jgi:hypothetical protein
VNVYRPIDVQGYRFYISPLNDISKIIVGRPVAKTQINLCVDTISVFLESFQEFNVYP